MMGWDSRKVSHTLRRAIDEGYIEHMQKGLYRNRVTDYDGYFDAFEYLSRVDKNCRIEGKLLSLEQYIGMFSPVHIIDYGISPPQNLTPFESELLNVINYKLAKTFSEYSSLCDAILRRQEIEKGKPLPDSMKVPLFDQDPKEKKIDKLDFTSIEMLYGDLQWEHIYQLIIDDIKLTLVSATLDTVGSIELANCHSQFVALANKIAKQIRTSNNMIYQNPDPETALRLDELEKSRIQGFLSNEDPPEVAVLVTHSPRTFGNYTYQVGQIIKDQFEYWSQPKPLFHQILVNSKDMWDDKISDDGKLKTRRSMLRESLIDWMTLLRSGQKEAVPEADKKFMLIDSKLHNVFTEEQIKIIIDNVENLIRRVRKFSQAINEGMSLDECKKDKEWFTEDEINDFSFIKKQIPLFRPKDPLKHILGLNETEVEYKPTFSAKPLCKKLRKTSSKDKRKQGKVV
jgi:hypothetical protein